MKSNALISLGAVLAACLVAASTYGQTIVWQEDWESPSATDDWVADFGYWEIGVPSYGPPVGTEGWRSHQGTNCAATVLGGDYTDDRQSRLSSSPISVPLDNPRLRFWHWWNFNVDDDYGQVQISTNNGVSWQPLSPRYGYSPPDYQAHSDGRWTRAWLDLTPYAGKTVRLGLYFQSHNWGGGSADVAPGWYVDEMGIESGTFAPFASPEDFEDVAAADRWTADFGVWEIGVPNSGPGSAHGGSNCLATILSGNYSDERNSRISGRPFVVPSDNPRLRFWHWWNFNVDDDYGQVQISTNNGLSWQPLSPRYGYSSPDYQAHSDGRWTRAWLDLTPYAGKTVRLGLYFQSHNWGGGSADVAPGWYVDEMVIESGPLAEMITPDSFEDAAAPNRWTADFGVWEIGGPTSGPGSAHAGSNCLATILSGNYYDDRSSRVRSQAIMVPPVATNPRLRFWHWWNFSTDDYGQVQISTNDGITWDVLASYATSSPWTQPQISLSRYAGKAVRLAFYFYSHNYGGGSADVAPGWYVDEVRLVHDFAAGLTDSPVVRTQSVGCVSLGIAASTPPSTVSFTVQTPTGHLGSPSLNLGGCWSGGLTPLAASQWSVALTNNCPTSPMGSVNIGSICFTAVSTRSATVPLTIADLSGPPAPRYAFSGRAITIADQPLLEAWQGPNKERMLTLYGIAGRFYAVDYATNISPATWAPGWGRAVPDILYTNIAISGSASNAPTLFLRAREEPAGSCACDDPIP